MGEGEGNYRQAVQMGSDQTKFAALIRHIGGDLISEDEVEALAVASRLRHFEKGETIIAEGEVPPELFILVSGVVRGYLLDASGKEVTDCILGTPGMVAMPYARLDAPSPSCVQALSTTVLLAVDMSCIDSLLKSSLGLNKLFISILQDAWEMHWEVERISRQCAARERYLWFLEKYPGLEEVVPARHIASFLGMTPVTLSRLRAALREEGSDPSGGVIRPGE